MVNNINDIKNVPSFFKFEKRDKFINNVLTEQFNFRNKPDSIIKKIYLEKKKIERAKIKSINVLVLKIINLVIKIFNKNYLKIDNLLSSNSKCNLLLKKINEISNYDKINYKKLQSFYKINEGEILPFEKNLYEIQIIQYEYLNGLLNSFNETLKLNNKSHSLDAYDKLPSCLKDSLKKLIELKTGKKFNKNIEFLLVEENQKSLISSLLSFYGNQIKNYTHLIELDVNDSNYSILKKKITNKIEREYRFINNLFNTKSKDEVIYDVSFERLLETIPNSILEKPITVTIAGVEYAEIIKQGGLAEAIEGLCKGIKEQNKENIVQVILPKYNPLSKELEENMGEPTSYLTKKGEQFNVYSQEINQIKIFFIEDSSFDISSSGNVYGPDYPTMANRFATFTNLATELIYQLKTDVIHLHDWHVSGIALKLKKEHKEEWKNGKIPPIVFTYHNNGTNSQGRLCTGIYSYDPVIFGYQEKGIITNNDNLFVKTLKIVDAVTTVSEKFGLESQTLSFGNGVSFSVKKAAKNGKLTGIVNGTDLNRWNPKTNLQLLNFKDVETNQTIDLSYGADSENLALCRQNAKIYLQKWCKTFFPKVSIDLTKPLVTFIGRYDSSQKGLDKFEEAIDTILKNGGQFVSIGISPDKKAEKILNRIERKYNKGVWIIRDIKDKSTGKLLYQEGNETMPGISALLRASSDFIFIPSSFEPCGLTQFEGWLFGSLAIASNTGGLSDTLITENPDHFNGYLFDRNAKDEKSLAKTLEKALLLWKSSDDLEKSALMKRLMRTGQQYSWSKSPYGYSPTQKYRFVYENAKNRLSHRLKPNKGDKINTLKYMIKNNLEKNISNNVLKEEKYLSEYYSKKYDSEYLDKTFNTLPKEILAQMPSPYGTKAIVNNYENYGAFLSSEGANFVLYAPKAKKVELILVEENGNLQKTLKLNKNKNQDWSLFVPEVKEGQCYYYKINGENKIDPYARQFIPYDSKKTKLPISRVTQSSFNWNDDHWVKMREKNSSNELPMSIFELHPGYWKRKNGEALNYRELGVELVKYCKKMGYTHVELMAILEYPTEISWGYQVTGYFAPTSRYGSIDDFKFMVNYLHQEKIGIILDWIPAHFAKDNFGLNKFDGSHLYDAHGFKYGLSIRKNWFSYGCKHFDFMKKEVREFLYSSAIYWLKEMHIDALRVDCIRSILESEDKNSADLFLKDFNAVVHKHAKGCYTIAEEYSGDRRVTASYARNGFEFDRKWHAGWMNGTIKYFRKNFKERKNSYDELKNTIHCDDFSRQVMFISHDQVKTVEHKNLINLFPDCKNINEKFHQLRAMLSFMMCLPGKKLIFMGEDSGLNKPWDGYVNGTKGIDEDLDNSFIETKKTKKMIKALNQLYLTEKALHEFDDSGSSIKWIESKSKIVHAYRRKSSNGESCAIFHNFTNVNVPRFYVKNKDQKDVKLTVLFSTDNNSFEKDNVYQEIILNKHGYIIEVPPLSTIIIKEEYV